MNGPAALGRRTRDCAVAAQIDDDAGVRLGRDPARGAIGSERLGGGAQIELDPAGDSDARTEAIDVDRAPPGRALDVNSQRAAVGGDAREVAVVAEQAQRAADGGVHDAVGVAGGVERDLERGQEQR